MKNSTDHFGFLYFATGKAHYLWEAVFSAVSVRFHHPNASIVLVTDWDVSGSVMNIFDSIKTANELDIDVSGHPYRAKVDCLKKTPFNRTLFLDCDTFVASSVSDIVSPNSTNFALAANLRFDGVGRVTRVMREEYCLFNTGVIYYTDSQKEYLTAWELECASREGSFKIPGIDANGIRSEISIGDQNVFNDLQISERWKIQEIDAVSYNFKGNIFRSFKDNHQSMSAVKIFHMHNCLRELLNLEIPSFDEIRSQFQAIRKQSTLCNPK